MTYKAYDIIVLVMLLVLGVVLIGLGLAATEPRLGELARLLVLVLGVVVLLAGIMSIGFTATQSTEMPCPHCGKKIIPKVKGGSGHLYLSRKEE